MDRSARIYLKPDLFADLAIVELKIHALREPREDVIQILVGLCTGLEISGLNGELRAPA
jgi:DNA-binding NtrC family response regulator